MAKEFLTSFFRGISDFYSLDLDHDEPDQEIEENHESERGVVDSPSSSSSVISSSSASSQLVSIESSSSKEKSTLSITDESYFDKFFDYKERKTSSVEDLSDLEFYKTDDSTNTKGADSAYREYSLTFNTDYLRTSPSTKDSREEDPETGKCNNFCSRAEGAEIRFIVQHYMDGLENTIRSFTIEDPVSAHYIVGQNGTIYSFVNPKYKAYHAGIGALGEKTFLNPYGVDKNQMNSWSIGIENINDGRSPFTKEQIKANAYLMDYIVTTYKVFPKQVISHSDWSPGRKIDVGPFFPWKELSLSSKIFGTKYNFGSYYHKTLKKDPEIVASSKKGSKEEVEHIQKNLSEFGYVVPTEESSNFGIYEERTQCAVLSFGLHYMQDTIVGSAEKMKIWDVLWSNTGEDHTSRIGLQEWTENHETVLVGLLADAPK